jgi:Plasmid encoded RepA protein
MSDSNNPLRRRALIKMVSSAAEIMQDAPRTEDLAFLARQLVQATLPHTDPGDVEVWMRRDGTARLMIRRGIDATGKPLGLPYGSLPRLLLYWVTTEAVRTQSPSLVLGRSLNDFMIELGLNPATGGGKRGDAKRLRDQMIRLFSASITCAEVAGDANTGGFRRADMPIATELSLWWSKNPDERGLWESGITLSDEFFRTTLAAPVPLDMRALRALKRSPLALDLYSWCAYNAFRAHHSGAARWITWDNLARALGADYATTKDFRRYVLKELRKVQAHFPGLKLGKRRGCLEVLPTSTPAVIPRINVDKPKG